MRKIARLLFPVDVSELCELAVPNFAKLAKRLGADLTLLHVVDTSNFYYDVMDLSYRRMCDIEAEKVAVERKRFDAFLASMPLCIKVRSVLRTGKIADEIAGYAQSEQFDAIIVPTTHHNRVYCAMKKSLTAKLMDESDAAIWTVDSAIAGQESVGGCVVCALALHEDGSLFESNRNIIETAQYIAAKFESELVFVHVAEKKDAVPAGEDPETWLKQQLSEACQAIAARTKYRLESGAVPRAISDVLWQERATLLVTGRNRRHPLFGAAQSRVLDIVHLSPCPVISVVRTPEGK